MFGELSKERASGLPSKQLMPQRGGRFASKYGTAAKEYHRESSRIRQNLKQLVREVGLIEQNKFSE